MSFAGLGCWMWWLRPEPTGVVLAAGTRALTSTTPIRTYSPYGWSSVGVGWRLMHQLLLLEQSHLRTRHQHFGLGCSCLNKYCGRYYRSDHR